MYYQNVRGLRTKLSDLLISVASNEYQIIILTETNLSDDVLDSELGLTQYSVFRKDRSAETSTKKSFGGVLIAVDRAVQCKRVESSENIEQLFIAVGPSIVGAIYLPPLSQLECFLTFAEDIDRIANDFPDSELCVVGDFNVPKALWINEDVCSRAIPNNDVYVPPLTLEIINVLSDLCAYQNLFQCNQITNVNNVILDLVLSHSSYNVIVAEPLVRIDLNHPPISFQIKYHSRKLVEPSPQARDFYFNYKDADFVSLNDYLCSVPWDNILLGLDVDSMLNVFYNELYNALHLFVPLKRVSARKFPRWFSCELKQLVVQKKLAHKSFRTSGHPSDYERFSTLRSSCSKLSKKCFQEYVQGVESGMGQNMKSFWNFINEKRRTNELPSRVFLGNQTVDMSNDAADLFAKHFSSVYSVNDHHASGYPKVLSTNHLNITSCSISISDIYTELSELNPSKGPGPDGIHPVFLKNCAFVLARPLLLIFNESLKCGLFPGFWKTSFVVPIYKSGERSDVKNYRPISLISTIPKIFESLVTKYLTSALKNTIIEEQYGFTAGRNTELNLVAYVDTVFEALECGSEVHSIYTDFSKAFDRVPHERLLSKLELLGITGPLLGWLRTYLSDRRQIVRVNNYISSEIPVPSGVPQGSHIGPLLFNIFINDVSCCFKSSKFSLFADDMKIFKNVFDWNYCIALQKDLDCFVEWCRNNGMSLNVSKCKFIRFSRLRCFQNFNYELNSETLVEVGSINDLGVILDSNLSFVPHISDIVNKSLRMLGFIKRHTSEFCTITSLKILYCALVRSHLEYASCVWSPHYAVHVGRIERVQKRFFRHINYRFLQNENLTYSDHCLQLKLPSLLKRREMRDLQLLFKSVNFLIDCPCLLEKIGLHVPPRITRFKKTFHQPYHRTNYSCNSFIPRVASLANDLEGLDFFNGSFSNFKARLLTLNT